MGEATARTGRVAFGALTAAGMGWGAWARISGVREHFLFGDEFHSIPLVAAGYGAIATTYDRLGSGLALPLLQRLGAEVLGVGHWSLRLPALAGSLGTLAAALLLGRRLGGWTVGAGAALLLALVPFHVFYGHFGRIYALVAFAGLMSFAVASEVLEGEPRRSHYAALAVLTGALPYLHLTAAAFAVAVGGGLVLLLALQPGRRGRAVWAGASLGAGIVLAALLHLPAASSLLAFVGEKTRTSYGGAFGLVDVLTLMAGSRAGGLLLLGLTAAGVGLAAVRRDRIGALLAAAVIGPWLALVAVRPFGDAYAYARYLIPSAVLLALWSSRTAAQLAPAGWRSVAGLAPTALILVAAAGDWPVRDGPHGNTYLAMLRLPAFDAAWPERSAFYRRLEGEPAAIAVIEAPALRTRSRHLHRNAFLSHRRATLLGFLPSELPGVVPDGPYVALGRDDLRASVARYLILHVAADDEVARYWEFAYAQGAAGSEPWRAFMERHRNYFGVPRPGEAFVDSLHGRLGRPVYRDRDVIVWDLRAGPPLDAGAARSGAEPGQAGPRVPHRRRP